MAFQRALALDDLWDGDMTGAVVAGQRVLLIRLDGEVHAYEDRCAHLGVALSGGQLVGDVVICRAHQYEYDARTGAGVNPRNVCLVRFPVRISDGQIYVDVDAAQPAAARRACQ